MMSVCVGGGGPQALTRRSLAGRRDGSGGMEMHLTCLTSGGGPRRALHPSASSGGLMALMEQAIWPLVLEGLKFKALVKVLALGPS